MNFSDSFHASASHENSYSFQVTQSTSFYVAEEVPLKETGNFALPPE